MNTASAFDDDADIFASAVNNGGGYAPASAWDSGISTNLTLG
jgi:hypothetical protein